MKIKKNYCLSQSKYYSRDMKIKVGCDLDNLEYSFFYYHIFGSKDWVNSLYTKQLVKYSFKKRFYFDTYAYICNNHILT